MATGHPSEELVDARHVRRLLDGPLEILVVYFAKKLARRFGDSSRI